VNMSEDTEKKEWPEVYDERMIKILTLSSGEKIITYVRELGEYGQYICERPFTVCADLKEGEYFLTQFCPYADTSVPFVFQTAGVIGVANTTADSRAHYFRCIREEVVAEAAQNGTIDENADFGVMMEQLQEQLSTALGPKNDVGFFESSSDTDGDNVVDLSNWSPDTKPN